MKKRCVIACLLAACSADAADFQSGQAARAVLGQPSFGAGNAGASNQLLGGVSGIYYANGRLYVADGNRVNAAPENNRVLIFDVTSPLLTDQRRDLTDQSGLCAVCNFPASVVLGQPDFTSTGAVASQTGMRTPTSVASDGVRLAVADTDNNRVLLWNRIPTANTTPADVVLGQPDFTTVQTTPGVNAQRMRGPQGVWLQNGKLFVADTQNHRVLIWNSIPTQNNKAPDLVLGQPNFNTANQPAVSNASPPAGANQLLNPVSVTSDGLRLYVSDLGFNRVLIWNSIPGTNQQPADVVIGQADMVSSSANNSAALCASTGNDSSGKAQYPPRCEKTLSFPRYALSDGRRLYIADGGNDRVLIFNQIPTANGAAADTVLGQPDMISDNVSDASVVSILSTAIDQNRSVDSLRTPMSVALDEHGNLLVSDPFDQRVVVYSPGDTVLPLNAAVNAASLNTRAEGLVAVGGTITANDTATITVAGTAYNYTVQKSDTVGAVAQGLVNAINNSNSNRGDPNVFALLGAGTGLVTLAAKNPGVAGNSISLAASVSNNATLTLATSGTYLVGGNGTAIAPGTLIAINGTNLSEVVQSGPASGSLPVTLGRTQVYIDGVAAPLMRVSPNQIVSQLPFTALNDNSHSLYVRTGHADGSVTITNAVGVNAVVANPGLFATGTSEPRAAIAKHTSSNAIAIVSVDGTIAANDTATITINGRAYAYTIQSSDTTATVRDQLISRINAAPDPDVIASAGGAFTRVVLTARASGTAGNGVPISTSTNSNGRIALSAYSSSTCCGNALQGQDVTPDNPAVPGEVISLYATGLGNLSGADANGATITGQPYSGPQPNSPTQPVNGQIQGKTGQILSAGIPAGQIGMYEVQMLVPTNATTDSAAQVYIAQNAFISNIVTVPIGTAPGSSGSSGGTLTASPNPIPVSAGTSLGQTTLTWNATQAQRVEVRIGGPGGQLFAAGGATGSATTGVWVSEGLQFYLQNASSGNSTSASNTIAVYTAHLTTSSTTASTGNGKGTLTASQGPTPVSSGASPATATLTWSATSARNVQVRVGSPAGPLFAAGGATGSATTGAWVTEGLQFFLQDATSGDATSSANTIAVYTAHLAPGSSTSSGGNGQGTLTATQGPTLSASGSGLATLTLAWTAQTARAAEIHIGSSSGPLFSSGGATGSATTGAWVTEGMQFYLQDATSGNATSPANTMAVYTAHLTLTTASTGTNTLTASPVILAGGSTLGAATLSWNSTNASSVQVRVGRPDGPLFAVGGSSGSSTTGQWITNGLTFYLQNATVANVLSAAATLATLTVTF